LICCVSEIGSSHWINSNLNAFSHVIIELYY
jgi:hypothetical protein